MVVPHAEGSLAIWRFADPATVRETRFYNLEMMFSRAHRAAGVRNAVQLLGAALLAVAGVGTSVATAAADDPAPPIVHNVKYTITTDDPANVQIWFLDTEPPDEFAWSHDSYSFARNYVVPFATETVWTWELPMVNPLAWAWVSASVDMLQPPTVRCELSIDGVVVVANSGDRHVLCSTRNW